MRSYGRLMVLIATLGAMLAAAPAQAQRTTWSLAPGIAQQLVAPDSPPPGTNDPSCVPRRGEQPVVLVHGLGANRTVNWPAMGPYLRAQGFCPWALTYGTRGAIPLGDGYRAGGLIEMRDSARQLQAFVAKVKRATGASEVDLVGHSQGTVMPQPYLADLGGAAEVDDFVALTPVYGGTTLGGLSFLSAAGRPFGLTAGLEALVGTVCLSCPDFLAGSEYLERYGEAVPGVDYTTIITRYDQLVLPPLASRLEGQTNVILQDRCPTDFSEHLQVAASPNVAQIIRRALRPTAPPLRCAPIVLPGLGLE